MQPILRGDADPLNEVLSALSVYLTVVLKDTAENVPGGLDLRYIDALICDLASDVTGTILRADDIMAGRPS